MEPALSSPFRDLQGPSALTDKSQTSGGQKTAHPTFQNKITKKQIQGKGRDSYPEQSQGAGMPLQDVSNHVRREGKILKQHRGTGLGLLLRLWESETVFKIRFYSGSRIFHEGYTHALLLPEFLTFQRKGGNYIYICPPLSDSSYAEMPETEVSFVWEKHESLWNN